MSWGADEGGERGTMNLSEKLVLISEGVEAEEEGRKWRGER